MVWDTLYLPLAEAVRIATEPAERTAIPHHSPLFELGVRDTGGAAAGDRDMALIRDLIVQGLQMLLVVALAPRVTGLVRKVKARLMRRQGPPIFQPYRDLSSFSQGDGSRPERILVFRAAPYLIFAATWVAAALVPTFATGLLFNWTADLIAIVALLGSARFFLALAGMDVGTSFGGIGSSREMMIASLAEPAMIMIVFSLALLVGSTQLSRLPPSWSRPMSACA